MSSSLQCVAGTQPAQGQFTQFVPPGAVTCVPTAHQQAFEFHWLAFAPAGRGDNTQRTTCELWRWVGGEWRSVFLPGTRFTGDELHDQGWKYCQPCEPLVVALAP